MHGTFRLRAEELNDTFIESIRTLFRGKDIEIVVTEVDETGYLLQSAANRARVLQAIANAENGRNLSAVDLAALQ
jgi:hypothetical protein